MTPRAFNVLCERKKVRDHIEDLRHAHMPFLFSRANQGKDPIESFMPTTERRKQISGRALLNKVMAMDGVIIKPRGDKKHSQKPR
jgi:hypothetical protein